MLRLFSTPDSPADPKLSKDIPGLSCGEPYFEYVLIEISIITSIYILLGVTIIINRLRVSHVAVEHVAPYPESLKIKIICLSVMMVGFLISVALAFFDSSFWLNACGHSLIGLCYGIHLLVTALNIAWLKYQYERRIPLQWYQNQLFWGLIGMNYLFSFITCYIINPAQRFTNPDFFLVLYRLLNSTFLMIYTIRRPQDRVEASFNSGLLMHLRTHEERFESEKDSPSRIRRLTSIKDIRRSSDAYSLRSSFYNDYTPPLIVTVANRIQNRRNFKNGNMEILYKINVKIGSLDYKIHRTLEDFRQLEISMIKENVSKGLKSSALDSLHAILSDRDGEKMSNVAFIVFTLQNFFTSICTERLPSSLLEFLEIPEKEYVKLVNRSRSSFHQHDSIKDLEGGKKNGLMRLPSDDFDEEDERRFEAEEEVSPIPQKKERRETVRVNEANSEDYFPYFNVNIIKFKRAATGDYIEFIINLHLTEKPDECWQIGKRYSDFVEVRQHLKGALNIIPPKLPPKLIVVTDDKQLEARRKGLESWLRVVLNEKLYFMPLLFQFVGLNSSYYEWLQDEELYDFSNFKAVIDKTQILMSNNKPYTVYHILLEENTEGILTKRTVVYSIYRRYKEFYQLNQALERRFSNLSAKLPELPPKFAPFLNNKDMAEFRQQSLEKYLNELFTFPDIGDSFAFRKFIHFKRTSETFKSEKEISEHLIDILGDVDSPNISNERMERALSTARSKKDLLDFVKNQAGL